LFVHRNPVPLRSLLTIDTMPASPPKDKKKPSEGASSRGSRRHRREDGNAASAAANSNGKNNATSAPKPWQERCKSIFGLFGAHKKEEKKKDDKQPENGGEVAAVAEVAANAPGTNAAPTSATEAPPVAVINANANAGAKQSRRRAAKNAATSENANAAAAGNDASKPEEAGAAKSGVQSFFGKLLHPKEWIHLSKKDRAAANTNAAKKENGTAAAASNAGAESAKAANSSAEAVNATVEPMPATATNGRMRARFVPPNANVNSNAANAPAGAANQPPRTDIQAFEQKVGNAFHSVESALHIPHHEKSNAVVTNADDTTPASRFQRLHQHFYRRHGNGHGSMAHPQHSQQANHAAHVNHAAHGQPNAQAAENERRGSAMPSTGSDNCSSCCCCCCSGACGGGADGGEGCSGPAEDSDYGAGSSYYGNNRGNAQYQLAPSTQSVNPEASSGPYDWDECECDGDENAGAAASNVQANAQSDSQWAYPQGNNEPVAANNSNMYPTSGCGCEENGGGNKANGAFASPPLPNNMSATSANTAPAVCGWVYVPCGASA
jgi:hypothetical protein